MSDVYNVNESEVLVIDQISKDDIFEYGNVVVTTMPKKAKR